MARRKFEKGFRIYGVVQTVTTVASAHKQRPMAIMLKRGGCGDGQLIAAKKKETIARPMSPRCSVITFPFFERGNPARELPRSSTPSAARLRVELRRVGVSGPTQRYLRHV